MKNNHKKESSRLDDELYIFQIIDKVTCILVNLKK